MAFFIIPATSLFSQVRPITNHTALYVKDLKKSAEFYKNVLNLEEIPEPFHDGKHVWFKTGVHSQLHVIQGAKDITAHDINIHFAYSVPDLAQFTKHLDEMHIKYGDFNGSAATPSKRPDGVVQVYFQDPDNFWIEVNNDKY